jgi:transcriptional regulator with XRE-family HTH domain
MDFELHVRKSLTTPTEDHVTNLKLWRLSNHLTQADAARRCGLGLSAYSLIEAGRLQPSPDQFRKLRLVFGSGSGAMLDPVSVAPQ